MGEPGSSTERFPLLDSLRALAALSILVVHVAIFTVAFDDALYGRFIAHLDIGVSFFFLLSAFLLYRPFVAARRRDGTQPSLVRYARRRFLRIVPAYWAVLSISALVPGMVGTLSGNWWVYFGLLQNYPIYTPSGDCIAEPLRCAVPTAWSLAVEVGFYLLLPLVVIGMASIARRWRGPWLVPEVVVLTLISGVSFLIQYLPPNTDTRLWLFFSPIGRGWWFALGLFLATLSVWVGERAREPWFVDVVRRRATIAPLCGVALFGLTCIFVLDPSPSLAFPIAGPLQNLFQFVIFGVIAALLMAPAVFGTDGGGLYRRFLAHPALAWLGLVSYGIFLWQFPVLIGLVDIGILDLWPAMALPVLLLASFAGTVACAAASYYGLERPLMARRTAAGLTVGPGRASPAEPAP